jgi:hypothetical protein
VLEPESGVEGVNWLLSFSEVFLGAVTVEKEEEEEEEEEDV